MSTAAASLAPKERLEVLFGEIAELCGQRNAIDGRLVEIVAELERDDLAGMTGARSMSALVAWKTGVAPRTAETMVAVAHRLDDFPVCADGLREGRLSLDQVGVIVERATDSEAPFPTRVDAFMSLVEAGWDSDVAARPHGQHTTVIVHLDIDKPAALHLGPVLTDDERRYLTRDATCETWFERDGQPIGTGRTTRTVSRRLRRALEHRDRCCAVPGCAATRGLHAHHIAHWEDGGPALQGPDRRTRPMVVVPTLPTTTDERQLNLVQGSRFEGQRRGDADHRRPRQVRARDPR